MKTNILPLIAIIIFASCSSAYRQTQTPDDVYYSPAKEMNYAKNTDNKDNKKESYSRNNEGEYDDYISANEDNYLRMKIQDRSRWSSIDDYNYWYSPNYAYNNYYGFNSFNPYTLNSWGLNYYYSPFASIQPSGWFNNYYPSYGFGYGYSPSYGGYYGHNYGYGYYGYSPVNVVVTSNQRSRTSRPLLGGYTNNNYSNTNNRRNGSGDRYVPINNSNGRYSNRNNDNNSVRYNNNNNNSTRFNNNNNSSSSAPTRSYTPSSSGSSSSGGGGVSRPTRH